MYDFLKVSYYYKAIHFSNSYRLNKGKLHILYLRVVL